MTATKLSYFVKYCKARSGLVAEFRSRISGNLIEESDVRVHYIVDIFEFLYMIRVVNIDTGEKISLLANAHNQECERLLLLTPAELMRLELNKTKIKDSMFSARNIKKLSSNYDLLKAIDQSDMARLMFKHMSRETMRKALVLFGQGGLVRRVDTGESIIIIPNGVAEDIFDRYLADMME